MDKQDNSKHEMRAHPIQLTQIRVYSAHASVNLKMAPKKTTDTKIHIGISCKHDPLNESTSSFKVHLHATAAQEEINHEDFDPDSQPFIFQVEMFGEFAITDTDKFNTQHIESWSKNNGVMILLPYMREQLYSMAQRCGVNNVIFPLVQIPTNYPSDATKEN